jgi:hypothetical protein
MVKKNIFTVDVLDMGFGPCYYYDVVNYIMGVLNGTFIMGREVSTS